MTEATQAIQERPANRRGRPVKAEADRKRAATYRLSPEAHELIAAVAQDMGLSQAAVIETAVRDLATARGLRRA